LVTTANSRREVLDRALHHARGVRIAVAKDRFELLLRDTLGLLLTERVHADLPQWLAPSVEARPEGRLAGTIPDESAVFVLELDVVAVDDDGRQRSPPCSAARLRALRTAT
jgi:hypothetical protein